MGSMQFACMPANDQVAIIVASIMGARACVCLLLFENGPIQSDC